MIPLAHQLGAVKANDTTHADHEHDLVYYCASCHGGACGICGSCVECGCSPSVENDVVRLLEKVDDFYEGAYSSQVHFREASLRRAAGKIILPFVNFGYLKLLVDFVVPGSRVLELGAASGMQLAGERFQVTALDLSFSSLKGAPKYYRHRLQADVLRIDFLPGHFDAIIASCFFEHFTPEAQKTLLAKLHAWLRPGGHLILFFDTASQSPLFRWLRRDRELYRQCFVDHDGHVGLQTVSVQRKVFDEEGFKEIRGLGLNRTLQHLPVYGWKRPYGDKAPWLRWLLRAANAASRRRLIALAFTTSLHLWDLSLGRLFPRDWSRLYLGVWQRP